MAVFDIKILRKQGRLLEAYDEAIEAIKCSNDSWNRMRMFWVLRDMCEQWSIPLQQTDCTKSIMKQMEWLLTTPIEDRPILQRAYREVAMQLLPQGIEMVKYYRQSKTNAAAAYRQITSDNSIHPLQLHWALQELYGWILLFFLKQNHSWINTHQQKRILYQYLQLQNRRPSLLHSQVLHYALSLYKNTKSFSFSRFVTLWNTATFRNEDFDEINTEYASIPSLFYRTFRELAKENDSTHAFEFLSKVSNAHKGEAARILQERAFAQLERTLQQSETEQEKWNALLQYTCSYSQGGPSECLSRVLSWAISLLEHSDLPGSYDFLAFMTTWNLNNFRTKDWISPSLSRQPTYALAERALIQCLKQVCPPHTVNKHTWEWIVGFCNEALKQSQDPSRILRYLGKVFLWMEDIVNARYVYARLAQMHPQAYYVWEGFAECSIHDFSLQLSLLLKALSSANLSTKARSRLQVKAAQALYSLNQAGASLHMLNQVEKSSLVSQLEILNTYDQLIASIPPSTNPRPLNSTDIEYYHWKARTFAEEMGIEDLLDAQQPDQCK